MRRLGYCNDADGHLGIVNTGTINITNITNITNVSCYGRPHRHHANHRNANKHGQKPPKLLRYCSTCGLLDQDVVANMSSGEMCDEAINVMGYGVRGLASCAGNVTRSVGGLLKGILDVAVCCVGAMEGRG